MVQGNSVQSRTLNRANIADMVAGAILWKYHSKDLILQFN